MGTTLTYPIPIGAITLAGITMAGGSSIFDPAQGVKRWVDPSKSGLPPDNPANYMVFDAANGTEVPLQIANGLAATANIPAVYPPPVAPTPTPATMSFTNGTAISTIPIAPADLSTQGQAIALASALTLALGIEFSAAVGVPSGWIFNSNGETREMFQVFAAGVVPAYAGQLLEAQSQTGIGSPGAWVLSAGYPQQVGWSPASVPVPNANTPPDVPVPVRALLPGESFQSGGLPGIWEVVSSTSAEALAAPATVAQVMQLQTDLNLIKQFLGISG
jgi:hypothetical protein